MNAFVQHTVLAADPAGTGGSVAMAALLMLPVVAYVVLVIGALVSIVASSQDLGMKLVWVVLVFVAPFIGSLLWFFVGRSHARRAIAHGTPIPR